MFIVVKWRPLGVGGEGGYDSLKPFHFFEYVLQFYHFFFQETQAVHMSMKQGTYLEFTIPMVVEEDGYRSKFNGQFFHLDATTSLNFRSLLECESLEVRFNIVLLRN